MNLVTVLREEEARRGARVAAIRALLALYEPETAGERRAVVAEPASATAPAPAAPESEPSAVAPPAASEDEPVVEDDQPEEFAPRSEDDEPEPDDPPRWPAPTASPPMRHPTGSVEEVVAALWPDLSVSTEQIAVRAGVSRQSVYNIRKRLGLPDRGALALAGDAEAPAPEAPPQPDEAEEQEEAEAEAADASGPPAIDTAHAVSAHGITVVLADGDECIAFGNETMDLTDSQAKVLAILLRAAPHPVGLPFIVPKVWPRLAFLAGEERLNLIARDLAKGLPAIGLELKAIKGVGLALGGFDT